HRLAGGPPARARHQGQHGRALGGLADDVLVVPRDGVGDVGGQGVPLSRPGDDPARDGLLRARRAHGAARTERAILSASCWLRAPSRRSRSRPRRQSSVLPATCTWSSSICPWLSRKTTTCSSPLI